MNTKWIGIALASSALLVVAFAQQETPKPDTAKAAAPKMEVPKIAGKTLVAPSDLKWIPLPGLPGAEQALVVGDPAKAAHCAFYKFPVGLKSPAHNHSYGDRGVVVSGVLTLAIEGAPAKRLPPGSYFSIGAGIPHVTAVEGEQPCVFFIEREGPFDVVVVEAGAK